MRIMASFSSFQRRRLDAFERRDAQHDVVPEAPVNWLRISLAWS